MPDRDNPSTPTTLAGLWLKSKPARRPRSAPEEDPTTSKSRASESPASHPASQMGLLFSSEPTPAQVPPPGPLAPTPPKSAQSPQSPPIAPSKSARRPALIQTPIPEHRVWTVRDLVTGIRQQLEGEYQDVWVEGEISNCRPASSGHIYFTLKDGEAQLPVVLFRRQAMLLRFRPQDGLAVLARGRISVYESRGQLQLIAEALEARGAGLLQLAYEQLKARLLAEGLFNSARKRPLPAFPHCIGVITSTGGAVLHDIVKVIRRRHAPLHLLIYPATVQGPGCAASVLAGLRWFNANHDRVDLIVIARGGGSLEDLAGFNHEALARAIAASRLPVVSAIGHETDFTIADFVADLRAPTPSAAAELITAAQHRIEERVQALDARIRRAIRYHLMLVRQRFTALSTAQIQVRLQALIGRRAQRLDDLRHRLESAAARQIRTPAARLAALSQRLDRHHPALRLALARRRLERIEQSLSRLALTLISSRCTRLDHATARLHALSPLAVLNRGYALVYAADGHILRSAANIQPGASIRARLAQGTLTAEVKAADPA
jgi:exodeoxyribonuclease VII large subunit